MRRRVVKALPVVRSQSIVLEVEELPAHFDQPAVLNRVLDVADFLDEPSHFFAGRDPRLFNAALRQSRGMGQLGVVVVTHDVRERLRRRGMRIDMGVRIDQNERFDLFQKTLRQRLTHDPPAFVHQRLRTMESA